MGYFTDELRDFFPELTPVSTAPTLHDLEQLALKDGVTLLQQIKVEEQKRYSAVIERDGKKTYYSMQNPAISTYRVSLRQNPIIRMKPERINPPDTRKTPRRETRRPFND